MDKKTLIPLIVSATLLAIALAGYVLSARALGSLQEESFLLNEEIKEATVQEARLARAQETLALLVAQENATLEYFVSDATLVDFLEILEAVGATTGTNITVVSVGADTTGKAFVINVTVSGQFRAVMRTLGAIETLPVFIVPDTGSVETVVREQQDPGLWTASVSYQVKKQ